MSQLRELLSELEQDPEFRANVTRWEKIPGRQGKYTDLPADLDPVIRKGLAAKGIDRLYSHQALCYQKARQGHHIVVVTPTASGKTLCYNLPVLQTLIEQPEGRALFLFPTKALSQDQQSTLNEIVLSADLPVKICTYDGDTPDSLRVAARQTGRIIISNPDMLHSGILPNHTKWINFFTSLKYVVIDELHTYRGVFGSHVTNLLRRLKRVCRFYGCDPKFICCSATIGNPSELARQVIEEDVDLIDENGSPSGEKHLIFYNPPLVDRVQGIRRGVVNESQSVALKFLKAGVKTIVFTRSRIRTELIASYINSALENVYNENNRIRVEPYRGGYLPSERRAIEKGLRDGTVHGVVSTNALELGIDIGGLDASILAGFPGTIASVWQQAGRSGRTSDLAAAILIASSAPIDQFVITHPEYFLTRSPESGYIDPDNLYILLDHLKCASFELPFKKGEGFPASVDEGLAYLEENGVLRFAEGTYYWADRSYPAESVSLRSATAENVVIIDTTRGANSVIGEMDKSSAVELIFDNAIYIHRGEQYVVKKLDLADRKCFVEQSDSNYYTDSIVKRDIKVLEIDKTATEHGIDLKLGDLLVRSQVAKFKKIRYHTHENIGYGDIFLPEQEMHTRGVALVLSEGSRSGSGFDRIPESMQGPVIARLGTLVRNTAPLFLLCNPSDLGVSERLKEPYFNRPALFVYDNYPGGTGLAEGFMEKSGQILAAAGELIRNCSCEEGCPSCVGPRDGQEILSSNPKKAVNDLLSEWLGR
jgi:DEAD/DEAH box helicase domain-containing protein